MTRNLILAAIVVLLNLTLHVQNDTVYVMKDGNVAYQQNTIAIDSIIFYTSQTIPDVLDTVIITNGTSASLQTAFATLNGSGVIIIKGTIDIDASIVIPSNIELVVEDGGMFKLDGVNTLTINGLVTAGLYPILDYKMEFSIGSVPLVKSEWFGTDDLAVNYALLSAGTIPVKITNDVTVDSLILLNSGQTLSFAGATIFTESPMTGNAVIKNRSNPSSDITVIGGLIDGSAVKDIAYDAVLFTGVTNALIQDVVCRNVHIRGSYDSGNFHIIDCSQITLQDVEAHDTWKMGIKVDGGNYIKIMGGYFTGCHDSGIGAIDSRNMHVDGVYVDNCGTSDASNITMNMQNGIFENSISINAPGVTNGNGLTLGHKGYPSFNTIVRNNLFINNGTKGVWSQGSTNHDISILDNIVMSNGNGSMHPNSAGVDAYYGTIRMVIQGNEVLENIRGVCLAETTTTTTIFDNRIINSDLYGIDNDGFDTLIDNNKLSNALNIFNDVNYTNLTATNNVEKGAEASIDYTYLDALDWLSDQQREVLNDFIK